MFSDIENLSRSGIYAFILPRWKTMYIGRTNNIGRRYTQHIKLGSHKEELKTYFDKYAEIEFIILEYTDGYKAKDQAIIEKQWIDHYARKGITLLNVTDPTKEVIREDPIPVIAFNKDTLEFVGEWPSAWEATKKTKNRTGVTAAIKESKQKYSATRVLTYNGCFWFYKEGFTYEMLLEKKLKYEQAKLNCAYKSKLNSLTHLAKKVAQYTKDGTLVKEYPSALEATKQTGVANSSIGRCCIGKQKIAGGYIWKYVSI